MVGEVRNIGKSSHPERKPPAGRHGRLWAIAYTARPHAVGLIPLRVGLGALTGNPRGVRGYT